ncbi:hypothetical protein ACFZAM_31805 [Streptomyces sp. NPDC008079]|uniref:hypothetical protein n=1 Tax=Streptomyces sp. NPDC008079 TaxID=3364806 RepID=UPI0036E4A4BB
MSTTYRVTIWRNDGVPGIVTGLSERAADRLEAAINAAPGYDHDFEAEYDGIAPTATPPGAVLGLPVEAMDDLFPGAYRPSVTAVFPTLFPGAITR